MAVAERPSRGPGHASGGTRQLQEAISELTRRLDAHREDHAEAREAYWLERERDRQRTGDIEASSNSRLRELEQRPAALVDAAELKQIREFLEEWRDVRAGRIEMWNKVQDLWSAYTIGRFVIAVIVLEQPLIVAVILWWLGHR